jgi:hypothetical protein
MKKLLLLATMVLLLPLSAQAGKKDTVAVEINTNRGPATITLVRKGDGFTGPRGEYYSSFPSKKTLTAVYGSPASKPTPTPQGGGGSGAITGDIKVVTVSGGVNILRNGKSFSQIRTKLPDIRGWKLIRENSAIVIKSGVNREPSIIELFDVRTGKLEKRIKATDVKDGKPAWAKHFAE